MNQNNRLKSIFIIKKNLLIKLPYTNIQITFN